MDCVFGDCQAHGPVADPHGTGCEGLSGGAARTPTEWPPKGADPNVFENVWGHLKAAPAWKSLYSATSVQLWTQVNNAQESLKADREYVRPLYDSLPSRTAAVVAVGGDMTRY
ncbi:hypothetical protein HPB52_005777 [Rhipicephalus sanguineus]|uniref:Uncharacterized protein n=1 Tax=Rhipicephalus sanguineus TaxID=34632 RepID=A0A9D4PUP2_RHISA|nr:hypothetical protein HPB52_005777 [Rhipicephalus sanguineus]